MKKAIQNMNRLRFKVKGNRYFETENCHNKTLKLKLKTLMARLNNDLTEVAWLVLFLSKRKFCLLVLTIDTFSIS